MTGLVVVGGLVVSRRRFQGHFILPSNPLLTVPLTEASRLALT